MEPFIRHDRTAIGGRLADLSLRRYAIKPRERFELNALEAIAVMVARGLGVSLVPDWPLAWPDSHALVRRPCRAPSRRAPASYGARASARVALAQALLRVLKRRPR